MNTHDAPDGERIELLGGWRLDTPRPGWGWALRDPAGRHLVNMRDEDARAFAAALSKACAVPDGWAFRDLPGCDQCELLKPDGHRHSIWWKSDARSFAPPAREAVDLAEVERLFNKAIAAAIDYGCCRSGPQAVKALLRLSNEADADCLAAIRQLASPGTEGRYITPRMPSGRSPLLPIAPDARKDKEPCGECRIQPGETCDVCGARGPMQGAPSPAFWIVTANDGKVILFGTKDQALAASAKYGRPTDALYTGVQVAAIQARAVLRASPPPPTDEAAKPLDLVAVRDGALEEAAQAVFAALNGNYSAYTRDGVTNVIRALKSPANLPAGDAPADGVRS